MNAYGIHTMKKSNGTDGKLLTFVILALARRGYPPTEGCRTSGDWRMFPAIMKAGTEAVSDRFPRKDTGGTLNLHTEVLCHLPSPVFDHRMRV